MPNLSVGTILRFFVRDVTPPKIKILIIVGATADELCYATVFINSKINKGVNYNEVLIMQHIELKASDYDCLHKNSHVDCSKIAQRPVEEILGAIDRASERCENAIVGDLNSKDLDNIKYTIKNSKLIKGKHKNKFGFYD